MQPQVQQQIANNGDNNNISPSSSTSPQHESILYSLEDDDRPQNNNNNMLSQRRYAQDVSNNDNNLNDKTNATYRRSLSSSFTDRLRSNRRRSISSSGIEDQEQQQGNNHFAIPTLLHNRISRSFDALDDNSSSNIDKEWKQSSILTCDTELIIPAPESTTDGSSDELLFNLEEGIESSLHRDDGLVNNNNNVNDNSLDTSFDADEYIKGLNPNKTNNNSTSPRSNFAKQATQKVFNALQRQKGRRQHLNKPISLTHQRYHRKSLLSSISSITSAAITTINQSDNDMNIRTVIQSSGILSDDTKHRIKSGLCCIIFGLCLIGLLYFMLKPLPT